MVNYCQRQALAQGQTKDLRLRLEMLALDLHHTSNKSQEPTLSDIFQFLKFFQVGPSRKPCFAHPFKLRCVLITWPLLTRFQLAKSNPRAIIFTVSQKDMKE